MLKLSWHRSHRKLTSFILKQAVSILESESDSEWVELLINEEFVPLAGVLNDCMGIVDVNDIKIEEIRAEDIIKKIYEAGKF